MKRIILTAVVISMVVLPACAGPDKQAKSEKPTMDSWKLAVQAYSFRKFTFFEAIEKAEQAGLKYIEAYPNQVISKDIVNEKGKPVKLWWNISPEIKNQIKAKLYDHNVRLINFGVTWLPGDEKGLRPAFEFAKEMGITTIISEPNPKNIPLIDKMCQEYNIKLGIHNHPKASRYWHPDKVLEAVEGTSKMTGACADTGHWLRSGLDVQESLKKLEGKIVSFHLKDLNKANARKGAHDVPWGTGVTGIKDVLLEAKRQNFSGVFTIEYEHKWDDNVGEIKKCVDYFNKTAKTILSK